ncbi:MAG: GNAT family N-acetyltransferase, partial [Rhodoglobus sp.]|nr:GNAT family N-acetyltransferase [Rhodoglobus sp.]
MTHTLRLATVDDLDAVRALAASCLPASDPTVDAPLDGELVESVSSGRVHIADEDGTIVGMLRSEAIGDDHVQLALLAVEPEYRRRGIGRSLVRAAVSDARALVPGSPVTATVHAGNVAAVALLASEGMFPRRGIRDYAGHGRDRLYCQFVDRNQATVDAGHRVLVPATATGHL